MHFLYFVFLKKGSGEGELLSFSTYLLSPWQHALSCTVGPWSTSEGWLHVRAEGVAQAFFHLILPHNPLSAVLLSLFKFRKSATLTQDWWVSSFVVYEKSLIWILWSINNKSKISTDLWPCITLFIYLSFLVKLNIFFFCRFNLEDGWSLYQLTLGNSRVPPVKLT